MEDFAQKQHRQTLYNERFEHDACGIGFVARMSGERSTTILDLALTALGNQAHRGAVAADAKTGDGAGILTQLPYPLLLRELAEQGVTDVPSTDLALGMLFLPREATDAARSAQIVDETLAAYGLTVLRWRDVPTDDTLLGERALAMRPTIRQVIMRRGADIDDITFERTLFLARKAMEHAFASHGLAAYVPSLSARTVVYKALVIGQFLRAFYSDLRDPDYTTALAVYHQRYSTNTFPTWERAQPFRMLSHNGEINTLQGNTNWMRAREGSLQFPPVATTPDSTPSITPVIDESGSDSAALDNVLELLVHGGRDIRHVMAMLVPEAWEKLPDLDPATRAFYAYHACLVEPWDGPAGLTFSDGHIVGTTLDRNGLRPARFLITNDGLVISGSEAGVVPVDPATIVCKGRLGPGHMVAVDTSTGQFFANDDIKAYLSSQQPYGTWLEQHMVTLPDAPPLPDPLHSSGAVDLAAETVGLSEQQMAFGYTSEELNVIIKPMMRDGKEPVGSMGDDTPLAILSDVELGRPLFQYFKQRFAEVTNPPIDPLREELVMSLTNSLGRRADLLQETPEHAHMLRLTTPLLTDAQLAAVHKLDDPLLRSATVSALMPLPADTSPDGLADGLRDALDILRQQTEDLANEGVELLVISDRNVDAEHAPIPALLALGAVHHHLIRKGLRSRLSLIVESGEPREVHHIACLLGYGAEAVNPYLTLATARNLATTQFALDEKKRRSNGNGSNGHHNGNGSNGHRNGDTPDGLARALEQAEQNILQALEKGLFKIMSKMGISPVASYCGAQIFESIGLDEDLIDECFMGTPARIGGIGLAKLAQDVWARHQQAFDVPHEKAVKLPHPGFYKYKKNGEQHTYSPQVIHAAHTAARYKMDINGGTYPAMDTTQPDFQQGYEHYQTYAQMVNERRPSELRDMLEFVPAGPALPLDEVEPLEAILQRFSTAAMSLGATSSEAHETLAVAMNRLGGMSNSGEGGEAVERYGNERNSGIKQVASGRFGVTPAYLASGSELQIKMAQGSKPGEGGQLPGHKVNTEIARIRHTTPGVSLISPPPHHDIYSIEDLAQLIYDLKQVNPAAAVSVKLVSTAGVGTIAAGVAKGYADGILISGYNGGTGASPLSSIKNAGMSWELGLAETQQTLIINGLRGRVRVRADGGFQSGRDVMIAAMLGADEYSFGTTALVAEGCLMARACHANTCPVGIASQRLDLRAKFPGTPEMVMAFFRYLAQEVREQLAALGLRSLDEAIGRTDLLRQIKTGYAEADMLHLDAMLAMPPEAATNDIRHTGARNHLPPEESLNKRLMVDAAAALTDGTPVELTYTVRNCERTVGATLAGAIGHAYGNDGLPPQTVSVTFHGSAGQSFGAFAAPGMHFRLIGEVNDYVGKGLAGGVIAVAPDPTAAFAWHENVIAGNTILYGATSGELFLAGRAGERFAVRNSGATAVVEGLGDHGCEYMTGGLVLVLGSTGYNFGAGMTGGVAYVLDEARTFAERYNTELVQLDALDNEDTTRVRALLERHIEQTGSPRAQAMLDEWETFGPLFWRVMPREAVAKIEAAKEGSVEPAARNAADKPVVA